MLQQHTYIRLTYKYGIKNNTPPPSHASMIEPPADCRLGLLKSPRQPPLPAAAIGKPPLSMADRRDGAARHYLLTRAHERVDWPRQQISNNATRAERRHFIESAAIQACCFSRAP